MQFRGAKLFEIMLFVYSVFGRIYILPVYVFRPYFNSTPFFSGRISLTFVHAIKLLQSHRNFHPFGMMA